MAKRWALVFGVIPGLVAIAPGCGSSTDSAPPGTGAGGAADETDGAAAGAGGRAGGASGGPSNLGGRGGAIVVTPDAGQGPAAYLGAACVSAADCGGTLICLPAGGRDLGKGGPANGACSADCSANPNLCAAVIDPSAVCVQFGGASGGAFCMPSCSIGDGAFGIPRCQGRTDVSCNDLGSSVAGFGFCSSQCRNDADCPASRKCDLVSGLCVDGATLTGTLPMGSDCDPNLANDPCRGFCYGTQLADGGLATSGFCTGFCSLGTLGCGSADGTTADGACLFPLSPYASVGDIGLCGQLCDCNDDCRTTGRVCRPLSPAEQASYGRAGYCGSATDRTTGGPAVNISCTDGGSEPVDSGSALDSGNSVVDSGGSGPPDSSAADGH